MANIAKAKRLQVHGLINHDTRSCENHTNEKIRPDLSHLNYNLVSGDPWNNYCHRMSQVFCRNRADINTLVQIAVTLPADVNPLQHEKFFQSVTTYYQNYFGAENVISAIVHLDETTPHLHIKAIPVYHNTKKDRDQVSFDVKCPRKFYKTMHSELEEWVSQEMGYHCGIQNEATREGNKSIKQLKALTATKEVKELQEMLSEPQKRLTELNSELNKVELSLAIKKSAEVAKNALNEKVNVELDKDSVKFKKSFTGKETVEVPKEVWEAHEVRYETVVKLKKNISAAEQEIGNLRRTEIYKSNQELLNENKYLRQRPSEEEFNELKLENIVLKQLLSNFIEKMYTGLRHLQVAKEKIHELFDEAIHFAFRYTPLAEQQKQVFVDVLNEGYESGFEKDEIDQVILHDHDLVR